MFFFVVQCAPCLRSVLLFWAFHLGSSSAENTFSITHTFRIVLRLAFIPVFQDFQSCVAIFLREFSR